MPNWCENNLKMVGLKPEIVQTLVGNITRSENVHHPDFLRVLYPPPNLREKYSEKELTKKAQDEDVYIWSEDEDIVEVFLSQKDFEWRRENWGVKWDIYIPDGCPANSIIEVGANYIEIEFLTPWAPPVGVYEYLYHDLGVKVCGKYFEDGIGYCGIWENGIDNEYDLNNREYPLLLDETFGITGRIEYREEVV